MKMELRLLAASTATVLVLSGSLLALTGCGAQDPDQTQVITGQKVEEVQGELTPLQKGEIRRDVLRVANPALASWLAGDLPSMSKYWNERFVNFFKKNQAEYAAKGQKRVRDFKVTKIDVVEFNNVGTQAVVDAWGYDRGYVQDASGKKTLRSNPKRLQQIELTVVKDKKAGKWSIQNAIMSNAILN